MLNPHNAVARKLAAQLVIAPPIAEKFKTILVIANCNANKICLQKQ
jgi:hypothetical protein